MLSPPLRSESPLLLGDAESFLLSAPPGTPLPSPPTPSVSRPRSLVTNRSAARSAGLVRSSGRNGEDTGEDEGEAYRGESREGEEEGEGDASPPLPPRPPSCPSSPLPPPSLSNEWTGSGVRAWRDDTRRRGEGWRGEATSSNAPSTSSSAFLPAGDAASRIMSLVSEPVVSKGPRVRAPPALPHRFALASAGDSAAERNPPSTVDSSQARPSTEACTCRATHNA